MKKFLLGTTALISFAAASSAMAGGSHAPAAAPANTGGLTVMVGGNFNFQAASSGQDQATSGTVTHTASTIFRNDTKLNVTAAGSNENFDYGAVIELNADTGAAGDKDGNTGNADKTYLFVENDGFGRFEAGANSGASQTLDVDASKIARATGGVDGDWEYSVNHANGNYIMAPNLMIADTDDSNPDSNKITYYTPRMGGVQLGVSFTPDTGSTGSAASSGNSVGTDFSNVFSGGINYESDVEGVGVQASIVAESGEAEAPSFGAAVTREDLSAYALGLGLQFGGFSVAGSYGDLGDSNAPIASTGNTDQTYWDIGAAYENGPYGVSVTYFESERGIAATTSGASVLSDDLTNTVVGADYQMAPGLTPYVEASFFDLGDGTAAGQNNTGTVVLVGAELAF